GACRPGGRMDVPDRRRSTTRARPPARRAGCRRPWRPPAPRPPADLRDRPTAVRACGTHPAPLPTPSPCTAWFGPVPTRTQSVTVRMPDVARFGGPSELPPSEGQLVEQAKADPEAFAGLYRRSVRPITGFAYRRSAS